MAKALLFNFSGEKKKKLSFLLMQYGITAIEGAAGDANRPIGAILGKDGRFPLPNMDPPFFEEMLVLDDLDPRQFHGLLNGMQMIQASVPYKAVTTDNNLSWTPSRLCRELVAEHEALKK